jgi:Flp pilus assembly protein TadB
VWEKASSRFASQHQSAICDGLSSALALIADAREKTGDLPSAERMMGQALLQAKTSKSAHSAKSLPSLYSNLARIQLASGDTISASTTLKVRSCFCCRVSMMPWLLLSCLHDALAFVVVMTLCAVVLATL